MNKQQLILALALLYIISQVVLLVTIGKDLELILISLGVFVASIVIVMMLGEISIGRPVLESVSMRRAQRSKAEQEKMLRKGYQIDGEFLQKKRFEFSKRGEKYTAPPSSSPAPAAESTPSEKTPQEKLRASLIAQSPMFGGIDKLLRTITSQNSTCSISRSAMVRWSSSLTACPRACKKSARRYSSRKLAASTTVTIVSSRATSERLLPSSSSKVNVSATGKGSEIPVDSITR